VFDENALARTRQDCLCIRIGIALSVAVWAAVWNEAVHDAFEIGSDVRVCVLVDGDARGGVRDVYVADSLLDAGFGDQRLDFAGYVNELRAAVGADA